MLPDLQAQKEKSACPISSCWTKETRAPNDVPGLHPDYDLSLSTAAFMIILIMNYRPFF